MHQKTFFITLGIHFCGCFLTEKIYYQLIIMNLVDLPSRSLNDSNKTTDIIEYFIMGNRFLLLFWKYSEENPFTGKTIKY